MWDRIVEGGGGSDKLNDVLTTSAGYVAVGEGYGQGSIWAVAVDKKGKVTWQKKYGKSSNDRANAVAKRPEGGMIIVGRATTAACIWAVAIDGNGAVEWTYEFCDKGSQEAFDIAPLGNDGYAIFGRTSTGKTDAILIRINKYGGELFTQKFQETHGGSSARGYGIAAMPDGGFTMIGEIYGQPGNAGSADMLVMRSDRWGHVSCKFTSACANLAPGKCDDKKPCTANLCDAVDLCHHKPLKDGAPCGGGAACKAGVCK